MNEDFDYLMKYDVLFTLQKRRHEIQQQEN